MAEYLTANLQKSPQNWQRRTSIPSDLTNTGKREPKPRQFPSLLLKSVSYIKKWEALVDFFMFPFILVCLVGRRRRMKRMNPSSITTLRSIPSTLRLLALFTLITGSAQDARKQQMPSQPGSKAQIPFFAEFLHLFFCITLSVFMAGVGRGKSCCLVPSLWHDRASAGTGPLCLGGAPPHPPLLLHLLNLLLFIFYARVQQGWKAPGSSCRRQHSPSWRQPRASGRGTETQNPLLASRVTKVPPPRWHPACVTQEPPPSPDCCTRGGICFGCCWKKTPWPQKCRS